MIFLCSKVCYMIYIPLQISCRVPLKRTYNILSPPLEISRCINAKSLYYRNLNLQGVCVCVNHRKSNKVDIFIFFTICIYRDKKCWMNGLRHASQLSVVNEHKCIPKYHKSSTISHFLSSTLRSLHPNEAVEIFVPEADDECPRGQSVVRRDCYAGKVLVLL